MDRSDNERGFPKKKIGPPPPHNKKRIDPDLQREVCDQSCPLWGYSCNVNQWFKDCASKKVTNNLLELDDIPDKPSIPDPPIDLHQMYTLKINEELVVKNSVHEPYIYVIIRRVPSGWIYEYFAKHTMTLNSTVFIPYRALP